MLFVGCDPVVEFDDLAVAGSAGTGAQTSEPHDEQTSGALPTAGSSARAHGGEGGAPYTGAGGEKTEGGAPSAGMGATETDASAGATETGGEPPVTHTGDEGGDSSGGTTGDVETGGTGDVETGGTGDVETGGTGGNTVELPPETVHAVVTGSRHTCLLYGAGKVKCWGDNEFGQLGLGDTENRGDEPGEMGENLPDVDLGTGRYAKAIAAGWYDTCVILDDDTVKCWGAGAILGTGDYDNRGDDPGEMGDNLKPVELGTGKKPLKVTLGAEHVCVILTDLSAKCWGWNAWYQLGVTSVDEAIGRQPGEMGDNLPTLDFGDRQVQQIAGGAMHTCGLTFDGEVRCWGYAPGLGNFEAGSWGQPISALEPNALGTGRTAKVISAGYSHSCAILDDDSLKCWGVPSSGELGDMSGSWGYTGGPSDSMGDALPVVHLGTGRHAVDVQSGGDPHTCALLDDGHLKCWGANTIGRLGSGDDKQRGGTPDDMGDNLPILRFGGDDKVKQFSTCVHGCALLETGQVKCWGWNYYGELGQGDTEDRGDGPNEMGDDLPPIRWW